MPATRKRTSAGKKGTKTIAKYRKSGKVTSSSPAKKRRPPKVSPDVDVLEPEVAAMTEQSPEMAAESELADEAGQLIPIAENGETEMDDFLNVADETTSILSIVKSLEDQIDTAFELKEALESELEVTRQELSEQLSARGQLQSQVDLLESQAAMSDQLREDIAFAEEERNKFVGLLAELKPQLEAVSVERDSLVEKLSLAEKQGQKLETERMTFEAQVMNLRDELGDIDRLREELAEGTEARRFLTEQVRELSDQLAAFETSKTTLEKDLSDSHTTLKSLREELRGLRPKLTDSEGEVADLTVRLAQREATNKDLLASRKRFEKDLGKVKSNYEITKSELEAVKQAMREIRNEASRASGRMRQRYFKPKEE